MQSFFFEEGDTVIERKKVKVGRGKRSVPSVALGEVLHLPEKMGPVFRGTEGRGGEGKSCS